MSDYYSPKELAKHFDTHVLERDAMETMIKSCVKENNKELIISLKELVYLDDIKDVDGKGTYYNKMYPAALERAKKVLKNVS